MRYFSRKYLLNSIIIVGINPSSSIRGTLCYYVFIEAIISLLIRLREENTANNMLGLSRS